MGKEVVLMTVDSPGQLVTVGAQLEGELVHL